VFEATLSITYPRSNKTLVAYGQAFGAERLVPIESAHLAGSFGVSVYKAYYTPDDLQP